MRVLPAGVASRSQTAKNRHTAKKVPLLPAILLLRSTPARVCVGMLTCQLVTTVSRVCARHRSLGSWRACRACRLLSNIKRRRSSRLRRRSSEETSSRRSSLPRPWSASRALGWSRRRRYARVLEWAESRQHTFYGRGVCLLADGLGSRGTRVRSAARTADRQSRACVAASRLAEAPPRGYVHHDGAGGQGQESNHRRAAEADARAGLGWGTHAPRIRTHTLLLAAPRHCVSPPVVASRARSTTRASRRLRRLSSTGAASKTTTRTSTWMGCERPGPMPWRGCTAFCGGQRRALAAGGAAC